MFIYKCSRSKKLGRNKENNRKRPLPFEPEIKSTKKPLEDISCNVSSKRSHPVRLSVSEGSVKQVSDVKVTFKTEDGDGLEDGETGELDEDDEEEDGEVRPEKEETIVKKEVETKKEEEVKEKIQKFVSKSETSISPVNKKDFSRNCKWCIITIIIILIFSIDLLIQQLMTLT